MNYTERMGNRKISNDDLPSGLLESITSDSAIGSIEEMSESVIDSGVEVLTDPELVSKIPIIGIFVALGKGVVGIRDWLYARKILSFLRETSKSTDQERKSYALKITNNPKENRKASIVALEILEKITTTDKAAMVGKIFRAYMVEDDISIDQFQLMTEMIDKAYLSDLRAIAEGENFNYYNLANVGIMEAVSAEEIMEKMQETQDRDMGFKLRGMSASMLPDLTKRALPTHVGGILIRILKEY